MLLAFGILRALAAASVVAGLLATVLGLAAVGTYIGAKRLSKPPSIVTRAGQLLESRPLLSIGWTAAIILGGIFGLLLRHSRVTECEQTVAFFASMDGNEELAGDQASARLADWKAKAVNGRAACALAGLAQETAALDAANVEIDRQRRLAADSSHRSGDGQSRAITNPTSDERGKSAAPSFLSRTAEIDRMLKNAALAADQSQWEECAFRLDEAQKALDEFRDTTTASSQAWLDRTARVAEQRKRIQSELNRIKEERQAAKASCAGLDYARARALFDALAAEPEGDEAAITRRVAGEYGVTVESLDRAYLACMTAGKIP